MHQRSDNQRRRSQVSQATQPGTHGRERSDDENENENTSGTEGLSGAANKFLRRSTGLICRDCDSCAGVCVSFRFRLPRSNNSLAALPDDLFSTFPANSIRLVDLSRNKFNATGVANLHLALAGAGRDLFLDLSFNDLGPAVPTALAQFDSVGGSLLLMGCGITDVQPNAFAGSGWGSVDLSLNDLRSGLHPQSFNGSASLLRIGVSNCNLRGSSLIPGVLDRNRFVSRGGSGASLFMDNLAADFSGMDTQALYQRFPQFGLSPKAPLDPRLLSAAEINPPGQPHTNKISVARYLESWANFFAPVPTGLISSNVSRADFLPRMSILAIGGELSFTAACAFDCSTLARLPLRTDLSFFFCFDFLALSQMWPVWSRRPSPPGLSTDLPVYHSHWRRSPSSKRWESTSQPFARCTR